MPETTNDPNGPKFKVELSFSGGDLSKPRWNFVQQEVFEVDESLLTLGPLWATTKPDEPYELLITLSEPTIDSSVRFGKVEWFDPIVESEPDKSVKDGPVEFKFNDLHSQVNAHWLGNTNPDDGDWRRWIYRLIVQRKDAEGGPVQMPVHLAFSSISSTGLDNLLNLLNQAEGRGQVDKVESEGEIENPEEFANPVILSTEVEAGEDVLRFKNWFNSVPKLPAGLALEPLIVLKDLSREYVFEFKNDLELFAPGKVEDPCNPGSRGLNPLAMIWKGVDPVQQICYQDAGFSHSTLDDSKKKAQVSWKNPGQENKSSSSFFFKHNDRKLVDPTIVHDPDLPP